MKLITIYLLIAAVLLTACASPVPQEAAQTISNETAAPAATTPPKGIETPVPSGSGDSLASVLEQQTQTSPASPSGPQPEAVWDTGPEALIISVTNCCGFTPEFVKLNYIPEAQVWGDGRILWTQFDETEGRKVLEGKLTSEALAALLQRAADEGFFGWEELYTSPLAPSDMPTKCIYIQLQDQSRKVCEYYEGAPEAFHLLYEELGDGSGLEGEEFVPARGYLTAFPNPGSAEAEIPKWDAQSAGVSLSGAVNGAWVEGQAAEMAWQIINGTPFGASVREDDRSYTISLQIPEVSLVVPPAE